MDNRETLTASSRDAILKRHLFSGVAKNWIKGRGDVGRAYFVRRSSRQSFGFRGPLRAAQFLKPPALPGDTYQPFASYPTGGAYRDRHGRGEGCGGRGSVRRAT